jgi:pimeloyl-ACP methyl ester carboxylesterase
VNARGISKPKRLRGFLDATKVNRLVNVIGSAVLIYAAYCLLLFLAQRHVLFPRYMIPSPEPPALKAMRIEAWWLETSFGKVEAWYLPPVAADKPAPAVIFGHGNGELIDYWPEALKRFSEMGIGLLLVEYPGYGRSAGSPSQESIAETFILAYDRLAARTDVDPSRIVLFGRSLGGGAVCDLALKRPSAALILMSCFKSVSAFAVRYLAPAFLIRDPFDNLSAVRRYQGPVLVMHGNADEVAPFGHGQALHAAAQNSKMIVYQSGHNDCPPDWTVFWRDVKDFLKANGIR